MSVHAARLCGRWLSPLCSIAVPPFPAASCVEGKQWRSEVGGGGTGEGKGWEAGGEEPSVVHHRARERDTRQTAQITTMCFHLTLQRSHLLFPSCSFLTCRRGGLSSLGCTWTITDLTFCSWGSRSCALMLTTTKIKQRHTRRLASMVSW